MNLYLVIRPKEEVSYDEYIGFVASAETEEEALSIHPWSSQENFREDDTEELEYTWPKDRTVTCTLIGTSIVPKGIVLHSFKAG